jgi:hypothetical protein
MKVDSNKMKRAVEIAFILRFLFLGYGLDRNVDECNAVGGICNPAFYHHFNLLQVDLPPPQPIIA